MDRQCIVSAVCHHLADWHHGSDNRIVSMVTVAQRSGEIDDDNYSSYPVTVDKMGNISIMRVNPIIIIITICILTESSNFRLEIKSRC